MQKIEIEFVADDDALGMELEEFPQLKVCAHPETTTAGTAPVTETTTVLSTAIPPTTTAVTTPKGEVHPYVQKVCFVLYQFALQHSACVPPLTKCFL